MWTLLIIYLAGGFFALGILKAYDWSLDLSNERNITIKSHILTFLQSWYGAGLIISCFILDISEEINNKNKPETPEEEKTKE